MNVKTEKINAQGKENLYYGKKNPAFEWKHGSENIQMLLLMELCAK